MGLTRYTSFAVKRDFLESECSTVRNQVHKAVDGLIDLVLAVDDSNACPPHQLAEQYNTNVWPLMLSSYDKLRELRRHCREAIDATTLSDPKLDGLLKIHKIVSELNEITNQLMENVVEEVERALEVKRRCKNVSGVCLGDCIRNELTETLRKISAM